MKRKLLEFLQLPRQRIDTILAEAGAYVFDHEDSCCVYVIVARDALLFGAVTVTLPRHSRYVGRQTTQMSRVLVPRQRLVQLEGLPGAHF